MASSSSSSSELRRPPEKNPDDVFFNNKMVVGHIVVPIGIVVVLGLIAILGEQYKAMSSSVIFGFKAAAITGGSLLGLYYISLIVIKIIDRFGNLQPSSSEDPRSRPDSSPDSSPSTHSADEGPRVEEITEDRHADLPPVAKTGLLARIGNACKNVLNIGERKKSDDLLLEKSHGSESWTTKFTRWKIETGQKLTNLFKRIKAAKPVDKSKKKERNSSSTLSRKPRNKRKIVRGPDKPIVSTSLASKADSVPTDIEAKKEEKSREENGLMGEGNDLWDKLMNPDSGSADMEDSVAKEIKSAESSEDDLEALEDMASAADILEKVAKEAEDV